MRTITRRKHLKKYNSVVERINAGDLDSLMTLYEPLACFASQPGEPANSPDSIQGCQRGHIVTIE